jgi:hypothetical protein
MSLFGSDSAGKRLGFVGLFQANAGNLTGGAADVNDDGTASSSLSVSGSYTVASNGRGTLQFIAPAAGPGIFNFSFYIVAKNELFFVSTDSAVGSDRLSGLVVSQDTSISFTNASFQGNAVFNLTGLEESTLSNVVAVGILKADGAGAIGNGSMFDENNAGLIISQQALSGSYSIGADGRGTVTFSGTAPAASFAMYSVTKNRAFVLDVASPAALAGVFVTGTTATANTGAANITGILTMDGISAFAGDQDESTPSSSFAAEAVAGSYRVASNGRGTMTLTSPGTTNRVFYVVNNSKFNAIGVDSGDVKSTLVASQR